MRRREFVHAMSSAVLLTAANANGKEKARRPLRILILGGTKFIGIHITELALQRGHAITHFNRGKTNVDLFPDIEHIKGDRDGQIEALKGRKWDAVIDDSGYLPRHVRLSAELLAPNVQRYLFVSTISVYASLAKANTEDSPVGKIADESVEKVGDETYGPLKALCERAAMTAMPGRVAVVRPGLIVGPHDPTDRFTYWPARAARGGEILAPDAPGDRIQIIDARDLAAFALKLVEDQTVGTFNAASPPGMFTMGDMLSSSINAADALVKPSPPPHAEWVPEAFLKKQEIQPWVDMPVWFGESGEYAGASSTSVARASHAGLAIRPIQQTVNDTLAWHLQRPAQEQTKLSAGLSAEREQKALSAWHAESERKS